MFKEDQWRTALSRASEAYHGLSESIASFKRTDMDQLPTNEEFAQEECVFESARRSSESISILETS